MTLWGSYPVRPARQILGRDLSSHALEYYAVAIDTRGLDFHGATTIYVTSRIYFLRIGHRSDWFLKDMVAALKPFTELSPGVFGSPEVLNEVNQYLFIDAGFQYHIPFEEYVRRERAKNFPAPARTLWERLGEL